MLLHHIYLITYFNRRNWILNDKPSISEIFEKYPKLIDYKGEMVCIYYLICSLFNLTFHFVSFNSYITNKYFLQIEQEFQLITDGKHDKFLAKFSSFYCPKILKYANSNRIDLIRRINHISDSSCTSYLN